MIYQIILTLNVSLDTLLIYSKTPQYIVYVKRKMHFFKPFDFNEILL